MADTNLSNIQKPPATTMSMHMAATNPHPQYLMTEDLTAAVTSKICLEDLHNVVIDEDVPLTSKILMHDTGVWKAVAINALANVPYATSENPGVVRLAVKADVERGVTTTVVTPNLLYSYTSKYDYDINYLYNRVTSIGAPVNYATTVKSGVVRLATAADITDNISTTAVTPNLLKDKIEKLQPKLSPGVGIDADAFNNEHIINVTVDNGIVYNAGSGINKAKLDNDATIEVTSITMNQVEGLNATFALYQRALTTSGTYTSMANGNQINCTLTSGNHVAIDPTTNAINCTLTSGTYTSIDPETGAINCTLQPGASLEIDPETNQINCTLDQADTYGYNETYTKESIENSGTTSVPIYDHYLTTYPTKGQLKFPLFKIDIDGIPYCFVLLWGTLVDEQDQQVTRLVNIPINDIGNYKLLSIVHAFLDFAPSMLFNMIGRVTAGEITTLFTTTADRNNVFRNRYVINYIRENRDKLKTIYEYTETTDTSLQSGKTYYTLNEDDGYEIFEGSAFEYLYELTQDTAPVENKIYYIKNDNEYIQFTGNSFVDGVEYYEKLLAKTYYEQNPNPIIPSNINEDIVTEDNANSILAKYPVKSFTVLLNHGSDTNTNTGDLNIYWCVLGLTKVKDNVWANIIGQLVVITYNRSTSSTYKRVNQTREVIEPSIQADRVFDYRYMCNPATYKTATISLWWDWEIKLYDKNKPNRRIFKCDGFITKLACTHQSTKHNYVCFDDRTVIEIYTTDQGRKVIRIGGMIVYGTAAPGGTNTYTRRTLSQIADYENPFISWSKSTGHKFALKITFIGETNILHIRSSGTSWESYNQSMGIGGNKPGTLYSISCEAFETTDTIPQTNKAYYLKDSTGHFNFFYKYSKFTGSSFVSGTTYYEYIDHAFVVTQDATYNKKKSYYTENGFTAGYTYYEITSDYKAIMTSDVAPAANKTYYVLDADGVSYNIFDGNAFTYTEFEGNEFVSGTVYYELISNVHVVTSDTTLDSTKTYYTRADYYEIVSDTNN